MRAFQEKVEFSKVELNVSYEEYNDIELLPHWHKEIQIYCIKKGEYEFSINNTIYLCKKGDVVVINSGDIHFLKSKKQNSLIEMIVWNPYRFENFYCKNTLVESYISAEKIASDNLENRVNKFFLVIKEEIQNKPEFYIDVVISEIIIFWAILSRYYKIEGRAIGKDRLIAADKVRGILNYLVENYAEDITLEEVAKMANYSPAHLSVLFSKVLGINFKKYLDIIRIENAMKEIAETDKTISQIALSNGFNNIRSFNRTFKNMLGITPTEFLGKDSQNM